MATYVEAFLYAGHTDTGYVIIEQHADLILNHPSMLYDGIEKFHKMKQPLCMRVNNVLLFGRFFFRILFLSHIKVKQPMCLDSYHLSPYVSVLSVLTQQIIEHGFWTHFDTVAKRELKLDRLRVKQDPFKPLTMADLHYGFAMYAIGLTLAGFVWICERFCWKNVVRKITNFNIGT